MGRLSKRAQREREQLEAQEYLAQSDENEGEAVAPATRPSTTFASLDVMDIPSEESESEEHPATSKGTKSKKKKKKKNKAVPVVDEPVAHEAQSFTSLPDVSADPTSKSKKKKSKAPKKDEIDLALEALALKDGTSRQLADPAFLPDSSTQPVISALRALLSVSPKHLDSDAELRRFFGSKVVNSSKPSSSKQHRNAAFRSQLTQPPSTWIMQRTSQGLSMRPLGPAESSVKLLAGSDEKWWTVEHDRSYKSVQLQFLQTVQLGDYQGFMELLRTSPWHIDTLLQMSEVARHQDDNNQASDFVARALFAYERAFTSVFNITTGACRLDFARIENRPFFLGVHRHILNLQKRGTLRTSFEFGRLLLSLDPFSDPHGALLHLDYLAPKSGMNEWLLETWDIWPEALRTAESASGTSEGFNVRYLPGWNWSRALATWNVEKAKGDKEHTESTTLLVEAIRQFPEILSVLADKANITLPGEVRAHTAFRISTGYESSSPAESTLHLLSHLYAHRASPLWKVPDVSEWVRSTVSSTSLSSLVSSKPSPLRSEALSAFGHTTPSSFVRHLVVSEVRAVLTFVDPKAIPQISHAYDPVPPVELKGFTSYDETYFADIMQRGGMNAALNANMGNVRARAQRHLDELLAQEGGGEDARMLQEMILAEIERQRAGGGGVPGAFPGDRGDVDSDLEDDGNGEIDRGDVEDYIPGGTKDEETDEDEEREGDEEPAQNGGFLQTVYGLLWGRNRAGPAPPEDGSER